MLSVSSGIASRDSYRESFVEFLVQRFAADFFVTFNFNHYGRIVASARRDIVFWRKVMSRELLGPRHSAKEAAIQVCGVFEHIGRNVHCHALVGLPPLARTTDFTRLAQRIFMEKVRPGAQLDVKRIQNRQAKQRIAAYMSKSIWMEETIEHWFLLPDPLGRRATSPSKWSDRRGTLPCVIPFLREGPMRPSF